MPEEVRAVVGEPQAIDLDLLDLETALLRAAVGDYALEAAVLLLADSGHWLPVSFTPAADFTGVASAGYQVLDSTGATAVATMTVSYPLVVRPTARPCSAHLDRGSAGPGRLASTGVPVEIAVLLAVTLLGAGLLSLVRVRRPAA